MNNYRQVCYTSVNNWNKTFVEYDYQENDLFLKNIENTKKYLWFCMLSISVT